MILLSADQHAQLAGYTDRFKRVTLKSWEIRGYEVSPYAALLAPRPRPKRAKEERTTPVSTIGTRVKEKTRWTGIYGCSLCEATSGAMNLLTAAEVRSRLDEFADRMRANVVAISKGKSPPSDQLSYVRGKVQGAYNQVAAAAALAVKGEDGILDLCREYIRESCDEEESAARASQGDPEPAGSGDSPGSIPGETSPSTAPPSPPSAPEAGSGTESTETPPGQPPQPGQTAPPAQPIP